MLQDLHGIFLKTVMTTETPLELKKTVNLPEINFAQQANLAQGKPARLKKWSKLNLNPLVRESRTGREKCARCRRYSTRVGESARYPTACERCVEALAESEREGGAE